MNNTNTKIVAYVRSCPFISRPTIKNQIKRIKEYADEKGLEIKHIFKNENVTTDNLLYRSEVTNLFDNISPGDSVVFFSVDRITTDLLQFYWLKYHIKSVKKANLIFIKQNIHENSVHNPFSAEKIHRKFVFNLLIQVSIYQFLSEVERKNKILKDKGFKLETDEVPIPPFGKKYISRSSLINNEEELLAIEFIKKNMNRIEARTNNLNDLLKANKLASPIGEKWRSIDIIDFLKQNNIEYRV